MNELKVVAVTGYKPYELGIFKREEPAISYIKKAIKKSLIPLLDEGLEWVVISGQQGVELWTAEVVFELQLEYPSLQLAVLAPFVNQHKNWKEDQQEYFEMIMSQADFFDSISKKEYEGPFQFRMKNEFITEKTDGLIILYDEEKEGTPKYQLQIAKKKQEFKGYEIYPITFYDLQLIVEEEMEE